MPKVLYGSLLNVEVTLTTYYIWSKGAVASFPPIKFRESWIRHQIPGYFGASFCSQAE